MKRFLVLLVAVAALGCGTEGTAKRVDPPGGRVLTPDFIRVPAPDATMPR